MVDYGLAFGCAARDASRIVVKTSTRQPRTELVNLGIKLMPAIHFSLVGVIGPFLPHRSRLTFTEMRFL